MRQELINLAETYRLAGDAIHDAVRESIRQAGGFLSCINNDRSRKDMFVQVYDSKKKYSESFPIRAMKIDDRGAVQVYAGTVGTVYTEKYLLTITALAAFRFLIPLACLLLAVSLFRYPRVLQRLAVKVIAVGLALFLLVPCSIRLADLIYNTFQESINYTI